MNNSKPHSEVLTFNDIDLDHISTIKKAIALSKRLKATTDKTSDAYIAFEMSELIGILNEIKTGAAKNIVRTAEHKRTATALEETHLNKCFDIPKDQIACSICSNWQTPSLIGAE